MREIKFRAWHNEEQRYTETNDMVIRVDGGKVLKTYANEIYGWTTDVELEQFTGLHDKNGKEIYEGDIVKVYGFSKVTVGKVVYENYYFTLDGFCDTGTDRPEMAFSEGEFKVNSEGEPEVNYEVVGNIHENKELLDD